jgi:hypothetical protein
VFRLCEVIGCPDPDWLASVVSVSTLQRWQKYQEQVGFRDDIHWGLLLSLLFNINRDQDSPAMKPQEWMPYLVEELPDRDELQQRIKETIGKRLKRISGKQ